MKSNRRQLERQALKNVCACWHFDLANMMDETSDDDLRAVIEDAQHFHKENQRHNPVSAAEYETELKECPESKSLRAVNSN